MQLIRESEPIGRRQISFSSWMWLQMEIKSFSDMTFKSRLSSCLQLQKNLAFQSVTWNPDLFYKPRVLVRKLKHFPEFLHLFSTLEVNLSIYRLINSSALLVEVDQRSPEPVYCEVTELLWAAY